MRLCIQNLEDLMKLLNVRVYDSYFAPPEFTLALDPLQTTYMMEINLAGTIQWYNSKLRWDRMDTRTMPFRRMKVQFTGYTVNRRGLCSMRILVGLRCRKLVAFNENPENLIFRFLLPPQTIESSCSENVILLGLHKNLRRYEEFQCMQD